MSAAGDTTKRPIDRKRKIRSKQALLIRRQNQAMRVSIGLIFGLILLWSVLLTLIYVVFRMVLLKESPGRTAIDLFDVGEVSSVNVTQALQTHVNKDLHAALETSARSKTAYVTLLHGIDSTFSYRGFLYNCLIVKKALEEQRSTADFVVLVGFTHGTQPDDSKIRSDLRLLTKMGIKLFYLPRLADADMGGSLPNAFDSSSKSSNSSSTGSTSAHSPKKVPFLEMALLKVIPWSFTQYERVQFFDGDVLPYRNMDCFFQLGVNTFNTGNASPLNSGWYLAVPNISDFEVLRSKAVKRMRGKKWDEVKGWGTPIPPGLYFRGGGRAVPKWSFNGASLDQGLLTDHFVLHEGRVQLVDTESSSAPVRVYSPGFRSRAVSVEDALSCCSTEDTAHRSSSSNNGAKDRRAVDAGRLPTDYFYHFTGRNKPWLQDLSRPKDPAQKLWAQYLDSLHLSVNSSNINAQKLNSPLGYFYPNK